MGLRDWETVTSLGGAGDTIAADNLFIVLAVHWKVVEDESAENEDESGENAEETFEIADHHHTLVDEQNQEFAPKTDVEEYVHRDDRFEAEVLTSERLRAGEEFVRTLVFDVPPNQTYTLKAELPPPSEDMEEPETFYMEVGRAEIPA